MNELNGTIICGDTHARWGLLNQLINKKRPERVIVCGDFGFWPGEAKYELSDLKNKDTKVYWCDGNHENHVALAKRTSDEVAPNVFYMPRGSTMKLPDGRTIMFFGGADSYDKDSRTLNVDWFKEELPTQEQLDRAMAYDGPVSMVVSHTAPEEFDVKVRNSFRDPTRFVLSRILEKFRPQFWYFGHWHWPLTGFHDGTRWTGLHYADMGNSRWWVYLR